MQNTQPPVPPPLGKRSGISQFRFLMVPAWWGETAESRRLRQLSLQLGVWGLSVPSNEWFNDSQFWSEISKGPSRVYNESMMYIWETLLSKVTYVACIRCMHSLENEAIR